MNVGGRGWAYVDLRLHFISRYLKLENGLELAQKRPLTFTYQKMHDQFQYKFYIEMTINHIVFVFVFNCVFVYLLICICAFVMMPKTTQFSFHVEQLWPPVKSMCFF